MLRVVACVVAAAGALLLSGCAPGTVAEAQADAETPAIAMPASATPATVNYVHDGDTLFLSVPSNDNLKVRLIGIDTPEVGDNLECYGDEATALLRSLLPEGTQVMVAPDRDPLDQYGRSLLYVFTSDGASVNLAMVASGAAEAVRIGQNDAYWSQLTDAESLARSSAAGMWGAC
jgi:micrococcal nuclease